ncbi:hypothetical protein FRX31_034366 [Thalictrum thalictroides]|uniref:FBD domain-containing protein n=1 Tax=Thalictrum thalictroides TaxID=46969 RepID=A0A7J6UV29_THATH|nr:hypothetical protein FRX31_034366 [Thalictrum thalictroides]
MALEGNVEIVEKLHIHVSCFESTISCSIKSLNLQKLELPNGNDDKEFILSCPVLEVLILHDCDYRHLRSFTISCSSLKRLDMNSLQSLSGNTVSCSLNICSPNLTSFAYKSWKFKDIAICNLSALISAHVHVQRDSHARHDDVQYLNEILKGISNVKSLSISSEVLKWFWESTKYEEHMGKDLPVVLSKFCYLKTVKVQNSFGTEDELKFFKFILERATMLKEMSIVTRKMDKKRMTKFKLKLFALKRISPGVLIHCRVGA